MNLRLASCLLAFVLSSCDRSTAHTSIDAGGNCPGSPSGGCEEVVASEAECPAIEDVCEGVCGASYDCCFCAQDQQTGAWQWTTTYLDCSCDLDAGVDATQP